MYYTISPICIEHSILLHTLVVYTYIYIHIPGCNSMACMVARLSISLSAGVLMTTIVDPSRHKAQPIFPYRFSLSFRRYEESTALHRERLVRYIC